MPAWLGWCLFIYGFICIYLFCEGGIGDVLVFLVITLGVPIIVGVWLYRLPGKVHARRWRHRCTCGWKHKGAVWCGRCGRQLGKDSGRTMSGVKAVAAK